MRGGVRWQLSRPSRRISSGSDTSATRRQAHVTTSSLFLPSRTMPSQEGTVKGHKVMISEDHCVPNFITSSTPPPTPLSCCCSVPFACWFYFMKPLLPASSAIRLSICTSAVNIFIKNEKSHCTCLLSHVHFKECRMLSTFSSNIKFLEYSNGYSQSITRWKLHTSIPMSLCVALGALYVVTALYYCYGHKWSGGHEFHSTVRTKMIHNTV